MKADSNRKYLLRYQDIIKELSQKHQVPVSDIEDFIDQFFVDLNIFITDPRLPKIRITNLGTFRPTIGKIGNSLKRTLNSYRSGRITKEDCVERFFKLGPVRRRLKEEKKGIHTWKKWRDMYKIKKKDVKKKESKKQNPSG